MPELPDVEVYKRYVDATSLHKKVTDVFLREQLVDGSSAQTIRDKVLGSTFDGTRRHGKHLFIDVGEGWLRLHFGMTGYLDASRSEAPPEHAELVVSFDDGSRLAYVNERKFGSIEWILDPDEFIAEHELGPDLLADDMDEPDLRKQFEGRSGTIKGTLMSQDVLAGLGNVYVDEILFQAGIHPESPTKAITENGISNVLGTMTRVVHEAIDKRADVGALPDDWLLPHRESGATCPRDGEDLEKIEVAGRATYLCPAHQHLWD